MSISVRVVGWEQRDPLLTSSSLVEKRLRGQHCSTPVYAFPARRTIVAHEVIGHGEMVSKAVVPSLHCISRVNLTAIIICKHNAKPFLWHYLPCGFSDVHLRLIPLDFFFSVKELITSLGLTEPPTFIKPVGTSFLNRLFTCQVKLKLACGFKYMGCIP